MTTREGPDAPVRWWSPADAAAWLGISRSRLYVLARANQVPHARLPGRGLRFNPDSLARWLTSREKGGDTPTRS